jgi:hypothetical protein
MMTEMNALKKGSGSQQASSQVHMYMYVFYKPMSYVCMGVYMNYTTNKVDYLL